jgi:hypothetical protein
MTKSALCLLLLAGGAAAEPFPFEAARAQVVFTATPRTFEGGKSGFGTCAAVVVDAAERLAAVPLQCVGDVIACRSAVDVPLGVQLLPPDFVRWQRDGAICKLVRRLPELNLALVRAEQAWPQAVRAPAWNEATPPLGSETWTIGFPEQVPSFLSRVTVAAVMTRVRVTGLSAPYAGRFIVVSGGARGGAEGSSLFDPSGKLLGIVIAHTNAMDGGFAVPAAELRAAIAKK